MWAYVTEFWRYFAQGGFVMPPLVLLTLVLWYALGYRYATLRRGNRRSVRVLVERFGRGDIRETKGLIDSAIVLGLALKSDTPATLRRHLDAAYEPYRRDGARFAVLVRSIVLIAPLLGLLGTVTGMIETFQSLGDMSLFSQSGGIAGGISQALFSTQMGLAVAVPGRVVGRMLDRRQVMIERELDQIKDILCSDKEVMHAA